MADQLQRPALMATKAWLRAAIECACGLLMGMMVAALLLRVPSTYHSRQQWNAPNDWSEVFADAP